MPFLETPRFPGCPHFGYRSLPDYSVTITATASGHERRNANWQHPLHRIEVTVGPRMEDEIQELLDFWHAVGGQYAGFRFKDYADFKTVRAAGTVAPTDQALTLIAGSPGGYQLTKTYTAGALQTTRKILKPVEGTVTIANNGTPLVEGSQYSLDYSTGLLTLFVAPAGPITWGGEFDLPVRFDSEFPVEIVSHRVQAVTFTLRELRNPSGDA